MYFVTCGYSGSGSIRDVRKYSRMRRFFLGMPQQYRYKYTTECANLTTLSGSCSKYLMKYTKVCHTGTYIYVHTYEQYA